MTNTCKVNQTPKLPKEASEKQTIRVPNNVSMNTKTATSIEVYRTAIQEEPV